MKEAENPFATWLKRHRMTQKVAAQALGCSPTSVVNWSKKGAPRYILLACAAYSVGLMPIQ